VSTRNPTTPLWWGAIVLRLITLVFACGALIVQFDNYERPLLGTGVFGIMCLWSGLTTFWYARGNRHAVIVVADVTLTCGLVISSLLVLSAAQYAATAPLITTVWASVPPVVAGTRFGASGGVLGGLAVAVATGFAQHEVDLDVIRDGVLLVASGLLIGAAATTAHRSQAKLEQALRAEAATAERERLARSIHDDVLQVLARVRRQGADLGGDAGELVRIAGEQEFALRALVSSETDVQSGNGNMEIGAALRALSNERVRVSAPADDVPLPAHAGGELVAATREALTNIAKHVGTHAPAWVLLEDLGSEVVVTVCDDGPGISTEALHDATAHGHFGVQSSIRGRIEQLGGTATLDTGPGAGTEWELRLPRRGEHG